jgi:2-phospho-L-lactate/phosphoenolpyruvate guanylyltransferase
VRWTVIVPLKALPHAKGRLAAATANADAHAQLVEAMREDTLRAARCTTAAARVVVVADRAEQVGADLVQSRPGLNAGLAEAARHASERWPEDGVAVLVGDLPALRPTELDAALADAAQHPRAYVPDAPGTGTTLLTARPGVALRPEFGIGSASRHAQDAVALPAGPGLRADVDTPEDLAVAARIGFGPSTRSVTGDSPAQCMMAP